MNYCKALLIILMEVAPYKYLLSISVISIIIIIIITIINLIIINIIIIIIKIIIIIRHEVSNLKQELVKQNNYIASLEKQLTKTSKYVKEHADDLQDIQVNLDNLEQYSRKNPLEFHGIPDEVNMPTDLVVCKIARAIGVEIQENDIEILHRIGRKRGDKTVLAKFVSHKVKSRIYKARTNLKAVSVQSLFPGSSSSVVSETTARPKGVYINENLTLYCKEMMCLTVEKRHDGKINKVWTLDDKIFIKTTSTGNPRQMFSLEDVQEL